MGQPRWPSPIIRFCGIATDSLSNSGGMSSISTHSPGEEERPQVPSISHNPQREQNQHAWESPYRMLRLVSALVRSFTGSSHRRSLRLSASSRQAVQQISLGESAVQETPHSIHLTILTMTTILILRGLLLAVCTLVLLKLLWWRW